MQERIEGVNMKQLSKYLVTAVVAVCAAGQAHAQEMYRVEGPQQREFTYRIAADGPQVNTFYYEAGIDVSPVKGAPYTAKAVTTMTQTLVDGNRIKHTSEVDMARDSEGRTRREQSLKNLGPWQTNMQSTMITINDPVAHVRYELHKDGDRTYASKSQSVERMRMIEDKAKVMAEQSRTVHVGEGHGSGTGVGIGVGDEPGKDKQIVIVTTGGDNNVFTVGQGQRVESDNKNVKTEDLGTQTIEGVSAQGTRKTITIPAGQAGNEQPINIVSETWYSPELKMTVMSKRNDPRVGETEFKLTNIQRGEPDASLFQLPAGVEVNEPKMRMREF
jgi:hypothetical protein